MPYVGIKELKNQTTEILRGVREDGLEYVVTFHGRPVAVLLPIADDFMADEHARAVRAALPSAELMSEVRAVTPGPFKGVSRDGVNFIAAATIGYTPRIEKPFCLARRGDTMPHRTLKTVASVAAVTASVTGLMMAPALKDLIGRKPTGARGVVTVEGVYRLCQRTGLQGWELVDFATRLVHDKFNVYSCRNLWDTPALVFKYGMGYCAQYNLALGQLLTRLGFDVQPVFALRIESTRVPEWRMGHTWLRVTSDGETRTSAWAGRKTKRGRWTSVHSPPCISVAARRYC